MTEDGVRRRPRVLSPETKWEIFLGVTSREMTQADAARKWHVDVSTIIGIRRAVKDAALAALAARQPGAGSIARAAPDRADLSARPLADAHQPEPLFTPRLGGRCFLLGGAAVSG